MNYNSFLSELHLLTDKQLAYAFHILFDNDWKKYYTEKDKAVEMISIFNGGTQPCRPFENWANLMNFLFITIKDKRCLTAN